MTVTGLTSNTTYYFAIKTSDEVSNVSSLSNIASQATASQQGGFTYYLTGVTGSATTYAGNATTYQTTDTLQTLRLAGNLTITGPQGAGMEPRQRSDPGQLLRCVLQHKPRPDLAAQGSHHTHVGLHLQRPGMLHPAESVGIRARQMPRLDPRMTSMWATAPSATPPPSPPSPAPSTLQPRPFPSRQPPWYAGVPGLCQCKPDQRGEEVRFVFRPMFNGACTDLDRRDRPERYAGVQR